MATITASPATQTRTASEVANQLVQLCSQGKWKQAIDELYSPDIVSVEAFTMDGSPREMKGIDAVRGKAQWWEENHEVHSATVEGPLVAGSHFSVTFKLDVTFKPKNMKFHMEEVAVYQVKDGNIIREEFFYAGM